MSQDIFWWTQLKSRMYPKTSHHSQEDWLGLYYKSTLEAEVKNANKKEDSQKEEGEGVGQMTTIAVSLCDTAFQSLPACCGLTSWTHLRRRGHRTLQFNHFTFLHKPRPSPLHACRTKSMLFRKAGKTMTWSLSTFSAAFLHSLP